MSPKTIFITSFFGFSARNILSTSILEILNANSNTRVVILAPREKLELYKGNFASGRKNTIVEGVVLKNSAMETFQWTTASDSRLERFFFSLFLNASDTNTRRVYRIAARRSQKFYLRSFFHWILAKLGNLKIFRETLRYLDFKLLPKNLYAEYFEKYCPDLVFSTDLFSDHDVQIMREARARKIPIVGMVRSWDNITSHGLNRIIPDKLIVNTPKIKEEAIRYCDISPEAIEVVGIPHYDRYLEEKKISRVELFKELNLDPKKRTLFFAPPSDIFTRNNPISVQVIKELSKMNDIQLIIRLYLVGDVNLGDIKPLSGKIAIDAPEKSRHFVGVDLAPKADAHLVDLIHHSDVVIAFASTLAIDATVLGKPVVFIGFDGEPRPYWESLRQYYDFDHQRYLLNTGGVQLAENMEGLVKNIRDYLNNPSLNQEKRKVVADEFCWKLDGKSGERAARFLINELKNI